ncbi:helix-turn-helix domain-containing protein [Aquamicrobium lusatiense]|uniref:helix-turn-helix domain-containing protein n=1 Tax=Aquamicrobium lusatiense TaxID=89772 RepID=UPI0024538953|nr:helix-turn-helix domain-containing protein [Aquamicrobium lusatiense]MDH4992339.1 helix-turn-helix domain-containing protein [Aquamicrobium lusatiense]
MYLAVERDTRGVSLSDADRFNYYPATPFPSISWILDGHLHMVEGSGESVPTLGTPLPKLIFSGPSRRPSASWSIGAVHVLTVSFYPEAMARLLDISIQHYVGSVLPLEQVVSGGRLDRLATIQFGPKANPFDKVQHVLNRVWDNEATGQTSDVRSWLALLATRAASSTGMKGKRSMQRLVKYWTGQSLRDLQLYARVENAVSHAAGVSKEERLNFAAVAAESGFSDQSHLGREIRRVTGLPPAKLNELVEHGEPFWMFRLLR